MGRKKTVSQISIIRGFFFDGYFGVFNKSLQDVYDIEKFMWVVLQKLPQLSDTHFSQVLNKLEKNFFMVL